MGQKKAKSPTEQKPEREKEEPKKGGADGPVGNLIVGGRGGRPRRAPAVV